MDKQELQYSIRNPFTRQVFMALAKKHELTTFRYKRQQRQTVMIRATQDEHDRFWSRFQQLSAALVSDLNVVTECFIEEMVDEKWTAE